jgi:hypothetical protein
MNKFLLSLTLLLSCLCQARLEVSFNRLSELPKILNGQTEAQLMITISKSDINANPDWEDQLKKSMRSVLDTRIDLKLELPPCVTKINAFFLSGCTRLIHLELPESITNIDNYFLFGCTRLSTFKLPNSVTKISFNFLSGCTKITAFQLTESIIEIGGHFLNDCTDITVFKLTKSVTKLGDRFLSGCTGLTFLKLPSSVTTIGDEFLSGLKNIEIHLILDRIDNVYFVNSNEISDMTEDEKIDLLQTKGSGCILWNGEEITPEEVYQKGHIINITVPDTCTLCLLPKKQPKKPIIDR